MRNPPTRYAATSMWAACNGIAALKMTLIGSTVTTCPAEFRVNHDGAFIQALAATTETAPKKPATTIGAPAPEVGPGRQAAPAEQVDGDEDGLEEEEDALERERHSERLTPLTHEPRPE